MKASTLRFLICVLPLIGCAGQNPVGAPTTKVEVKAEEVKKSGFLKDYSILREGGESETNLVYWNPTADFSGYHSFVIDPVTVWAGSDSNLNKVSPAERQEMANAFYSSAVNKLTEDFKIVSSPGPGTFHLRIAFPADYGGSGVMTFICNHLGKVYEKDLGEDSDLIAGGIVVYNPEPTWSEVR